MGGFTVHQITNKTEDNLTYFYNDIRDKILVELFCHIQIQLNFILILTDCAAKTKMHEDPEEKLVSLTFAVKIVIV